MIQECEDLLISDLAEYYNIYDYKSMSPATIAALAANLRQDSRAIMYFSKQSVNTIYLYMAQMIDSLNILIWQNTKNGHKGIKRPKSLYTALTEEKEKKDELETFDDPEDYLRWRQKKGM